MATERSFLPEYTYKTSKFITDIISLEYKSRINNSIFFLNTKYFYQKELPVKHIIRC